MDDLDLYEEVVALLNRDGVDFKAIAAQTGLNPKTLRRIAGRENDAMHGTLKRIKAAMQGQPENSVS